MKSSNRKYAITAGLSLLVMAAAAAFSYGYVFGELVSVGDPKATFQTIKMSATLFKSGIAGWGIIFVTDIMVAIALYKFLKRVNPLGSFLVALIRIAYAGILCLSIYHLFAVLPIIQIPMTTNSVQTVQMHLESFERVWSAGLILFGLHLIGLGILVWLSDFIPRIWAILLIFAGLCYFGIHAAKVLLPEYIEHIEHIEMILGGPMAIGEIGFAVWLLVRGGKTKYLQRANATV